MGRLIDRDRLLVLIENMKKEYMLSGEQHSNRYK